MNKLWTQVLQQGLFIIKLIKSLKMQEIIKIMNTNLILSVIALLAFLGVAFYSIYTIDDKPEKKKT